MTNKVIRYIKKVFHNGWYYSGIIYKMANEGLESKAKLEQD